ncbi:MAG: UDP-N-acetylglucosamine--N-acetylmuramyl-(pentapeptide) pyrophosphoryl-undecaprenol N-acetylglucosamine transferase [Planctomycetes bacterium]|nr:UDP-N-acetylglucosamine--N-acetylmuramyl-(pentapeptide) pyrophosphoryl-undecaprenol N-acetylglucosamine transferase [Planctomycetota bacterium]
MTRARTIVFVGGGTGGHLQPGVVLRDALLRRHPDWKLPFLIAGRAVERSFVPPGATGLELFPGRTSRPAPWRADLWAGAWFSAARFLSRVRPDLLVFLGGYVAFIARAARWRVPMVVLESNVLPGRSARLAAPFAKRLFLQWMPPDQARLPMWRTRVTGMPLKFERLPSQREARLRLRLRPDARVLLVLGGSLGATPINDRVVAGAADLASVRGLQVLHLSGPRDEDRVQQAYAQNGVDAVVLSFCDAMADCYAAADLVVARAGGMTVAELAAAGRPALFIPYPHHADHHQEWNARVLVDGGAAWMVREADAGSDFVRRHIVPKLADLDELEIRGRKAAQLGRRDGTHRIVEEVEQLLDAGVPVSDLSAAIGA